mmetsp:Transcript_5390/g.11976  ORF Transcript_5390/g.11976 Transcript_5390/m.11976 type:complete len:1776 (-) Transcript_5390:2182-7509(-)
MSSRRSGRLSLSGKAHPNTVVVYVLEARGLIAGDKATGGDTVGTSDPFVHVLFAGQDFKTRVEHKCKGRAHWDEKVNFVGTRRLSNIQFLVYDKDQLKKDFLGFGVVEVNTVRELKDEYISTQVDCHRSIWLKLTDKYGTAGEFGELRVAIGWTRKPKVHGKTRISLLSTLGIRKTQPGENVDVLLDEEEDDFDHDDLETPVVAPVEGETTVTDAELSSDEGEITDDEDVDEVEAEKVRLEKEKEELQEELERACKLPIKKGAYRVLFHVIEVRELKGEDLQGTSDPVCVVSVDVPLRQPVKRSTSIKKSVRSCVFDEQLFLDLKDMDEPLVESATIRFAVMDADLISRNDLIGSFTFNLIDVYYKKGHQQKNLWLGLIDEKNPKDKGIQGYAKVSVTVLGPGDTVELGDEGDEAEDNRDEEISEVLLPPNIQQELHFLRLQVYKAEDLPTLDTAKIVGTPGIDAFVRVDFNGNPRCKTKTITVKKSAGFVQTDSRRATEPLNVVYNEEMWLPTWTHRLSKNIQITLYDYDAGSKNDLVSTLLLNYQDVLKSTERFPREGYIPPRWYYLYGAPTTGGMFGDTSDQKRMNKEPSLATAYRGRILLGLRDHIAKEDSTEVEAVHKKFIRSIRSRQLPPTTTYVLRLWAICGSEIPKKKSVLSGSPTVSLALSIGPYKTQTKYITSKKGCADWCEALEMEVTFPSELLDIWNSEAVTQMVSRYDELLSEISSVKASISPELLRLRSSPITAAASANMSSQPVDEEKRQSTQNVQHLEYLERQAKLMKDWILQQMSDAQVPDVFLYLQDKKGKAMSYCRMKPSKLLFDRFNATPKWIPLQEDKANDLLDDDDFPGSVLVCMGLGSQEMAELSSSNWAPALINPFREKKPHTVRINVYQGAQLPSADASALSDPYIKVKCLGHKGKVSKRHKTCDPMWYEVVELREVMLPPSIFSPQVVLDIYDYDPGFDADDYLGTARIPVANREGSYKTENLAHWHQLFQIKPGDCGLACVLVSVDVFPEGGSSPPPPPIASIVPSCSKKAKLQIVVLGARNLEPYKALPISNPVTEFHLGDASKRRNVHHTKKGKGPNPNFGELIEIKFNLPDDLVFMPRLHLTVTDSRFGGLDKPVIGTRTVDILKYVPSSGLFEGSSGPQQMTIGNPNMSSEQDLSPAKELDIFLEETTPELDEDNLVSALEEGAISPGTEEEDDEYESSSDEDDDDLHGNGETEFVEWPLHDPLPLPTFMSGRHTLEHQLENELGPAPFQSFELFRGQLIRKNIFGKTLKSNLRKIGVLKAKMRILIEGEEKPEAEEEGVFAEDMLEKIMIPRQVHIRVNVLKGFNFTPMDIGSGKSDPYLILKLGRQKINDKKNYLNNEVNPCFYKTFELQTELPGASVLTIKAMDYDTFSSDDLIGATYIDLEDRWFSQEWQNIFAKTSSEERTKEQMTAEEHAKGLDIEETKGGDSGGVEVYRRKPVELRSLWTPTSQLEQGKLELWCDIMDQATAIKYPKVDVTPPENNIFELRVIVWKADGVPNFDTLTDQSDLFVKCNFNGFSDKVYKKTDVHWFAKNGKASWNYRLKFEDIALPISKLKSRLTFQLWDMDTVKWNDCIAETVLDLDSHLKSAFLRDEEVYQVFDDGYRRVKQVQQPVKAPISTTMEPVQPDVCADDISISIDSYTGIPRTNADGDDLNSMLMPKKKKKKKRRKVVKVDPKNTDPAHQQKQHEANEFIDNYVPSWLLGIAQRAPPNSKALKMYAYEGGVRKEMGNLWVSVELVKKRSC